MKKELLLILLIFGAANLFAQTPTVWEYNFGTQAATFDIGGATYSTSKTAKSGAITNATDGENLPAPYSGQTARISVGSNSSGGYALVTSGSNFPGGGGGARLSMTASNAGQVNKFSVYNIGNGSTTRPATNQFSLSFNVKFVSGSAGTYQLVLGNGTTIPTGGSNVSDTNRVMSVLRWALKASPTKYTFSYREGVTQDSETATSTTVSSANFLTGGEYNIQVFCNNSADTKSYTKFGTSYDVAPYKYHVWVGIDRLLIGTVADFNSGGLAPGTPINFFGFFGNSNSSGDPATIILDDIRYANYLVDPTTVAPVLPVTLTSFTGKKLFNSVALNWTTASEQNNAHFNILHSTDGRNFEPIAKIDGNNNSNTVKNYSYIHYNVVNGTNYYQLQQVDHDGKMQNLKIIAVSNTDNPTQTVQVYAVPAEQKLNLSFYMDDSGIGTINIYSLNGGKLISSAQQFKKGYNSITVPFDAPQQMYSLQIQNGKERKSVKFLYR